MTGTSRRAGDLVRVTMTRPLLGVIASHREETSTRTGDSSEQRHERSRLVFKRAGWYEVRQAGIEIKTLAVEVVTGSDGVEAAHRVA
jgi:hypothetical protein